MVGEIPSKRVILLRHAEATNTPQGSSDFERSLSDQGRKDAQLMGQKLKGHLLNIDQIFSSPSKRTSQTAKHICREIGFEYNAMEFENSLYNGSAENIIDCIQLSDSVSQCVIIIVHNPSITELSNQLQKDRYIANLPPCGMVSISFSGATWLGIGEGSGTLDFYEYPNKKIY